MIDWERRIARAEELEREVPAAAEMLRFFGEIAKFQRDGGGREELQRSLSRAVPPEFLDRVLDQRREKPRAPTPTAANLCPRCGSKPVAAVLRPEGEGGKRFLLCSLCLAEWEFRRLVCPHCGEESHDKLPVYTAGEFPHIRIDACDSCRVYLKTIDLTRDGLAVPEVDEIASVALDLWAREKGYTKLQTNLLGI
ncbi:MAG TPA: formate dehydrogenase accessory protein FdhE [Bryobacteraceae bacterium]